MKRIFKTLISLIIILCTTLSFTASATDTGEIPYKSYTYWVDYNTSEKTAVYSKPMYEVKLIIDAKAVGADENSMLNDATTDDNGNVYILDSGNSKIYILNKDYTLISTLQSFIYNGENISFINAKGIFVSPNGFIYVADTENQRVLVLDKSGNISRLLLLPDSDIIPTGFEYKPSKVAVDSKGYTYIASEGSYYGAILYSPEMEFLGFFGANTVKASVMDVISSLWEKLTSNDIKRAADELSLPYTFTDIVVGPDDFVYTATGKSGEENIQTGQIAMLNPGGKDVLGESDKNFADSKIGKLQYNIQVQDISNIAIDKNGFMYCLDSTYGRIFLYDSDCNLLSAFGGSLGDGNQKGTFTVPSSIAVSDSDILVTDSQKNSLTVFKRTEYGEKVYSAQNITLSGDFAAAKATWEQVIKEDGNCQLAYRGLAKAYYDLGENTNAMKYAKMGCDRETYSKAFELNRTELIENNFYFIALALVLLIVLIAVLVLWKRRRGIILIKNTRLKNAVSSVAHPAESFRLVKEKGEGSIIISAVILILFYVVTVLNDTVGGFAFTVFDSESYNSVYVLLSTVGLVILWTVSNWLVCTLAGGIGKLKEIFTVTCYSLIPIVFARAVRLILTHILTPSEGAFLNIFVIALTLYAAFMLIIGIMRIHDYEFGKFIGTTIFTLIAMLIIIFLIFLIVLLSQQFFGWIGTIYIEARYR